MEPYVRKTILLSALLLATAACATAPASRPVSGPTAAGALAPRLAVDAFLDAVRVEDIQAMGALFGTSRGALRDAISPSDRDAANQLEKRLIILQCYLAHDSYRILSEAPGDGGSRMVRVELARGNERRQPALFAVEGPGGRWYIENVELAAVRDFCGLQTGS